MSIRIDGTNTTDNPGITGSDTDTGLQFGTNEVKIVTDGSDRVTVDSEGNVGIGTTSPGRSLTNAGAITFTTGTAPQYRLNGGAGDSNDDDRAIFGLATSSGHFFSGSAAGDAVLRSANNGDLLFGSGTNERMRLLSGGGLTFNGDTATPNGLNDYEEGDFDVSYVSGLTSDSYANTGGHYTKIGNLVTFTIRIAGAGTNSSSEQVQVGNLPFTSNTARQGGAWFNYKHDLDTGGAPYMHIAGNGDDLLWYGSGGNAWVGSDGAGLNGKTFHIQGFYYTDS